MSEQQRSNPNKDWQDLPPIDAFLDHDDDDLDTTCSLRDSSLCFLKDYIDLHSTVCHQHVLAANRSMPASPKKNISLSKLSESSNSKSKLKPISGTGTITVVTKTTTTTTITGFPAVDVSSQQFDAKAQRAPSPTDSCSSRENSYGTHVDDEMLSNDSDSESTSSSSSSTNKNPQFSCLSNQQNGSNTCISTSNHLQAASQSRTPKTLKWKPKKTNATTKSKRTTTSYDAETTAYLKKAFFNYYSKQYKLTREQRETVIRETGLRSRNITYWFSNHKRRLGAELAIYRKLIREHKLKDYDAFLRWRQDQELPDHITREEIKLFKESR
ncbi:hypothetical protein G6F42_017292 [Rhizopus arrhizus]|nr:hypothetical protein G6F42_017292 [Rhizopus arrhizus]